MRTQVDLKFDSIVLEACINSSNSKVIRLIHLLLTKLMALFPTERTNLNMSCKYEELVPLYSTVDKVIQEGLKNENNFPPTISTDKNIPAGVSNQRNYPSGLFSTLMILKAACINNSSYIDLQIISFIRVLHKIAKEHLRPAIPESSPSKPRFDSSHSSPTPPRKEWGKK